jgi:peptidoglycan/LPS O-acetylase OafA/YrhL
MNRIKSIDGLRALSIIMVLLGHAGETMPAGITDNFFFRSISDSALGVNVFFVISGYLITKLLLIEQEKTGKVNLKHFYLRRIFRIFPIFYVYILVLIGLKLFFIKDIFNDYKSVVIAGLYLWNYTELLNFNPGAKGGWFFGHFWTLAMEEQFYLLWPIAFKLCSNRQLLKKMVLIIIILMPLLRVATYVLFPKLRAQIGVMLPTNGDAILIGCWGALIECQAGFAQKYLKLFQSKLVPVSIFIFLFVISPLLTLRFKGAYDLPVGKSLLNISILYILFWSIYVPTYFARILNTKLLVQIGILSYSIYIWQQLILTPRIDTWFNKFPQNFVVVFIAGFLSYYIIEKPILKLKDRFKDI